MGQRGIACTSLAGPQKIRTPIDAGLGVPSHCHARRRFRLRLTCGLFIPETAKEKPQEARVVKAGPGRVLDDGKVRPMIVKEGDRILLSRYPSNEVKIDGEDFVIVREDEILAVLD
jgi:chaperonin GroES